MPSWGLLGWGLVGPPGLTEPRHGDLQTSVQPRLEARLHGQSHRLHGAVFCQRELVYIQPTSKIGKGNSDKIAPVWTGITVISCPWPLRDTSARPVAFNFTRSKP